MQGHDLTLLTQAAQSAGVIAMSFWRLDPQVWHKADQSPLSEADLAVNTHLHDVLCRERPSYGWLSEETDDKSDRLGDDCIFIIDPIDGTRAFIAGETTFSISMAVARQGQATAAVVYLPALNRLYSAFAGGPAMKNGAEITVASTKDIAGSAILANKAAFDSRHWSKGVPEAERVFRSSIAYRLCLVAEGRHDAMVAFGNINEWDVAAGSLIAACAGARVSDVRGETLHFNKYPPHSYGVLAAPGALHDKLRARM